jgi:hypothetical protein
MKKQTHICKDPRKIGLVREDFGSRVAGIYRVQESVQFLGGSKSTKLSTFQNINFFKIEGILFKFYDMFSVVLRTCLTSFKNIL